MSLVRATVVCAVIVVTACEPSSSVFHERVLVDSDSLRVVGADTFPKDLECEIHVGESLFPFFATDGGRGRIDEATIYASLADSVSLYRKTGQDLFVLSLAREDHDGRIVVLYDVNMDGRWDVKKTPTREERVFIFFQNEWIKVDSLDNLTSMPTAVDDSTNYQFRGTWSVAVPRKIGEQRQNEAVNEGRGGSESTIAVVLSTHGKTPASSSRR